MIRIQNTIRFGEEMKSLISTIKVNGRKSRFQHFIPTRRWKVIEILQWRIGRDTFLKSKSITRFYKNEDRVTILTPMGIQQFFDYNRSLQLEAGHLKVSYRLLTLDGEQDYNYHHCGMGRIILIKLSLDPAMYIKWYNKPLKEYWYFPR